MTESDSRLTELKKWLALAELPVPIDIDSIRPASSDASFRRYFRVDALKEPAGHAHNNRSNATSLVVMDAPPSQENCTPFVFAASVLAAAGVTVPAIHAADIDRGFLAMSDLGSTTMLQRLTEQPDQADNLYRAASAQLITLQQASTGGVFAPYDRQTLLTELRLFDQWYLTKHLNATLSEADEKTLFDAYEAILDNNLAQSSVFIHRDWHSRNLMVLPEQPSETLPALAVIDFQDALYGPVTYDLVSLLRDAYIDWPEDQQIDWAVRYWDAARIAGVPVPADFGDFYRDFEWMGMQRHLKVLGIFARLAWRDGKKAYIDDMPRVRAYIVAIGRRYRELAPLVVLMNKLGGVTEQSRLTF